MQNSVQTTHALILFNNLSVGQRYVILYYSRYCYSYAFLSHAFILATCLSVCVGGGCVSVCVCDCFLVLYIVYCVSYLLVNKVKYIRRNTLIGSLVECDWMWR